MMQNSDPDFQNIARKVRSHDHPLLYCFKPRRVHRHPEHSLEWLLKQDFDFEGPMAYPEFVKGIGALFMGASTYEWLLSKSLTTLNSCARNVESENSNKNSK